MPDLDKKLKTDKESQWAASAIEAAIDEAIHVAYGSGQSSRHTLQKRSTDSATSAAADGTVTASDSDLESDEFNHHSFNRFSKKAVNWGDGMGSTAAAQATAGPGSSDLPASSATLPDVSYGCTNTNEDEQCIMDWGSLDSADAPSAVIDDASPCAQQMFSRAAVKVQQHTGQANDVAAAHTFLQRVLYMINRLNHFWYDRLTNYTNERSLWLSSLRDKIEGPWQDWEDQQLLAAQEAEGERHWQQLSPQEIKDALVQRYHRDVAPPLSPAQQYITNDMGPLGYCHLLAVGALDGLVEASRQSRVCAGVANEVACTIFRVLMEEYGTGRLSRKHSTFYQKMMQELGLSTRPEAYLDQVPWQYLAAANHNFLLTERRRHYLRYAGALSFFEINGPSVYKTYLAAGQRCGLSEDSTGYWALHIKEDERHGRQMLDEVAVPLVDMYPDDAWEILWGYDQDRFMGARAGAALVQHIKAAAELQQDVVQEQQHVLNRSRSSEEYIQRIR
eukprot:gene5862-6103_t